MTPDPPRLRLRRRMRLRGARAFRAVYRQGHARRTGPLVVHVRPNGSDHLRLGLSVARRVGPAVVRNRIKRLLREAFRLDQRELPGGYDIVVRVCRHEPLGLGAYRQQLGQALRALHRTWTSKPLEPPEPFAPRA